MGQRMLYGTRGKNGCHRTRHGFEHNVRRLQRLSRGAEPRAQSSAMHSGIVVCVMRCVREGLRVNHATEDQQEGRETGGKDVSNSVLHGSGSNADREACCVSRSTT